MALKMREKRGFLRKKVFGAALAAFAFLFLNAPAGAQQADAPGADRIDAVVMSFNVFCSFCPAFNDDGIKYDPWPRRLKEFADIIARHKPDLIGLQELSYANEVGQMLELNPGYGAVYYPGSSEDGGRAYPDACILYKSDRFEALERGNFWLSRTPDKPWTRGWADGAQLWRIVAWARFKELSTGREFYFATTHFDNNRPNQEMSAPVALERIAPWAEKMPVLFVGDFNSAPDSPAYKTLTEGIDGQGFKLTNAYDIARENAADSNQDAVKQLNEKADPRIDHIFLAGKAEFSVSRWAADLYVYGPHKRLPSDHRAIVAEVEF